MQNKWFQLKGIPKSINTIPDFRDSLLRLIKWLYKLGKELPIKQRRKKMTKLNEEKNLNTNDVIEQYIKDG